MSETTALLVIDMQLALVAGAYEEKNVIAAVNVVIRKARAANGPIFFIQHNHETFSPMMKGSDGWQIHPSLDRTDSDHCIEKQASDAFFQTTLNEQLQALGISQVVVTGMQTEFCVDATCRSALSHNFDVVLIQNGHTTGDSHLPAETIIDHHNKILANLAHPNCHVTLQTDDEVMFP